MRNHLWATTALALLTLCLGGCGDVRRESGGIIDVRPTRLGLGDTLIVEGERVVRPDPSRISFRPPPSFRAKARTTIILDGKFTYPGRVRKNSSKPEVEEKRVEIPAAALTALADPAWSERVVARITATTRNQIGYARFEGRLGVRQVEEGSDPVERWTTVEVTFFRPGMRSLADLVARYTSDWQVRSWLGIKTRAAEAGGIEVTGVRPDSLAAHKSRLQVGDRLVKVDGMVIHSERQLTVAARKLIKRSVMSIKARRGGREFTARFGAVERIRTASGNMKTVTKPPIIPISVVYLIVMLIFGVVALTVALVTAGLLTWVERRVAGRIQSRIGPNRVGPQGILQWLADGIKLLLKEDVIPDAVDRPLFKLAPYLVFMGLLGTFVVLPFGQFLIISDLNVGLLYLLAITGFVSLGLMMAGWSSNNKWSLLGGMRSAAQIISYEIPSGLALMVPVVLAGTLSTHSLVELQGGWPWQWFAFDNPFAFVCFFIYFVSALAEGNRTPFDLPEAESELVAGYQIEYSGWRFAVFMMSEWANIFVIGAVATTVFLGGWQVPGLTVAEQATSVWWQLAGLVIFYAKSMGLVFVIIWIRWTLPRFRVDQMMGLCWKYFVPWCFVSIIAVALWAMVAPPWMRLLGALGTTGLCGGGLAFLFFARVYHNWRKNPEDRPWSWNPFY